MKLWPRINTISNFRWCAIPGIKLKIILFSIKLNQKKWGLTGILERYLDKYEPITPARPCHAVLVFWGSSVCPLMISWIKWIKLIFCCHILIEYCLFIKKHEKWTVFPKIFGRFHYLTDRCLLLYHELFY